VQRNRRLVAISIALVMGLTACGSSTGGSSPSGVAVDSLDLTESGAAGLAVYRARCAACHSSDLSGGTGRALGPTSDAAGKTAETLRHTITRGATGMPSWVGILSDQEISDVVAFLLEAQGR
jgi:mono/diheme cytochrome c family protein